MVDIARAEPSDDSAQRILTTVRRLAEGLAVPYPPCEPVDPAEMADLLNAIRQVLLAWQMIRAVSKRGRGAPLAVRRSARDKGE